VRHLGKREGAGYQLTERPMNKAARRKKNTGDNRVKGSEGEIRGGKADTQKGDAMAIRGGTRKAGKLVNFECF